MNVADLMTRETRTVRPDDTLERAAGLMWDHDCGCLPVVDEEGRPVAMLTDRDVCMNAYTCGGRLADLPVRDAMSRALVSVRAGDPLARAERLMQEHQVRRLPVVDAEGRLAGLISLMDLARGAATRPARGLPTPRGDEVAETLAVVGRPHGVLLPELRREAAHPPRVLAAR